MVRLSKDDKQNIREAILDNYDIRLSDIDINRLSFICLTKYGKIDKVSLSTKIMLQASKIVEKYLDEKLVKLAIRDFYNYIKI